MHLAARLVAKGLSADRIVLVDPGSRLLERWDACVQNTGMTYLRSPAVPCVVEEPAP